jgi:hypothetical protein
MRSRSAKRVLSALATALLTVGVSACGDSAPAEEPQPTESVSYPPPDQDARVALAARAALAEDHRFSAIYTLQTRNSAPRSVLATVANDGTWRVDIPSGALGGTTDVSVAQLPSGVFQCAIPSATNPISPSCVRVAAPGKKIPHSYDPRVQRVFRQWLPVFTDRQAALSVTAAQPLAGSTGSCFSIDSISASLSAPVDVGIYCYADDGLLTAARVSFGTVTIAGPPAPPPATINLPGPVTGGEPMGRESPSPPPPVVPPSVVPAAPVPSA